MNIRKGRLLFVLFIAYVGFKVGGWQGAFSFVALFFLGCFLFYYIFEPIFRDITGLFSRMGGNTTYNIHVNTTPGQDGHPDIEGTARRRHQAGSEPATPTWPSTQPSPGAS